MIILGFDPGSIKVGYGLIEVESRRIRYVDSGVLSFDARSPFFERLGEIARYSKEIIELYSPHEIALESLIYVKNPTSLIKLAQARGVILAQMVEGYGGRIFEYSPNLVKSTATGYGHADKLGVQKFLEMILGVGDFKSHDESDALAVAICHALNRDKGLQLQNNKKAQKGRGLAASLSHRIKER